MKPTIFPAVIALIVVCTHSNAAYDPSPTNLHTTEITDKTITFSWTDNSQTEDKTEICTVVSGTIDICNEVSHALNTSHILSDLIPATTATYVVQMSINSTFYYSNEVTVTTTHTWSDTLIDCIKNYIDGSIPTKQELERISEFTCINKGLTDITALQDVINIKTLTLDNNLLTSIPSWIDTFTSLESLSITSNQLSGTIPENIGNLTALTSLRLNNNRLSGSIPSTIGNLENLISLSLANNQLTGSIPTGIGNLVALESLSLNDNLLANAIPSEIQTLTNLKYLRLYNNLLTNSIPSTIGVLTNLQILDLHNNHLDSSIPSEIGLLNALTQLNLSYNKLENTLPTELGSLSRLTTLYLNNNCLSGEIPASIIDLNDTLNKDIGLNLNFNCGLFSNDLAVQEEIDKKSRSYGGYAAVTDTNQSNSRTFNIVPIICYLLN